MDPEAARLVALAEANAGPAAFEARPQVRGAWTAFLVLTLLSVVGWIGPFLTPAPLWAQGLAALWFGGWSGLFARLAWRVVAGARSPAGWALRAGPEGLKVNLRSHLNYRHPAEDAVVAILPRSRVRRLTFVEEGRRSYLEVGGWSDLEFARGAVDAEAARWSGFGLRSGRARHVPVTVEQGRLRIAWRDAARTLSPSPVAAEAALGRWFPMGRRLEADLAALASLPRTAQERRLGQMARSGEAVAAIALARELWGLNLTEARQRIDALASLDSATARR
ncbi:hypothetical protein ACFODL_21310 [Phenylobacterium terrae]|uniref:Uncharacterized protein n=1 Tax=Phenylobacterium terrae TaxID=2665495 RepID=A0ABW4N2E2_9CAUL